ncbi:MAG: GAF domain-containing protein [Cyclobacteriaceae bacterium]|nr:GAF domain-containing protein [Cyclobacteriaceae bacterium]
MKISNSTIGTLLLVAFIISLVISAFFLFSFQGELIYTYKVLNLSEIERASGAFYELYTVISFTLLLGLSALIFTKKFNQTQLIYVERKERKDKNKDLKGSETLKEFDLNFFEKIENTLSTHKKIEKGFLKLCEELKVGQAALYLPEGSGEQLKYVLKYGFALNNLEEKPSEFSPGDGLVGQVAKEGKTLSISDIPSNYIKIISGLGKATPGNLVLAPIMNEEKVEGVIELALFAPLEKTENEYLQQIIRKFGSWHRKVEKPEAKKKETKKPSSK